MTQSAMSLSSIIEVESDCIPMNIISPITLDWGASMGTMPSGSSSLMVTSFSDTVCLALNTSIPQSNSTHTNE